MSGFAVDPLAGEEASTLGRLTILQARMNPDLATGDELLKKTGSGNLVMVFGEPDIGGPTDRRRPTDARDPRTGCLRPDDRPAALIVGRRHRRLVPRHRLRRRRLLGPPRVLHRCRRSRLRKALKTDSSDEAWATVNRTISRPFPGPKSGKIAVKVINRYGDEVMKVFAT